MGETINKKYIGRNEVASILGVSRQTVLNYIEKGCFKCKRIGKMVYIDKTTMYDKLPQLKEIATLENAVEESKQELQCLLTDYRKQICEVSRAISADKGTLYISAMKRLMKSIQMMGMNISKEDYELMETFFLHNDNKSLSWFQGFSNTKALSRLTRILRKAVEKVEKYENIETENARLQQKICKQKAHIQTLQLETRKREAYIRTLEIEAKAKRKKDVKKVSDNKREIMQGGANVDKIALLSMRLRELNLPIRVLNGLRSTDIDTLGQIIRLNITDFLKIRNFGKRSLEDLRKMVESKGLRFGMTDEEIEKFKYSK